MPNRTPLYDWHVAHGARMVDFAGWEMPVQYTSIVEEHQAVRTALGWFDISHMGRLVFHGPKALDLIQRIYTNDAAVMQPGQIRYGLICNDQGGILDDVLVYRLEPFWLMVVNASNREKILSWIREHQDNHEAQVTDKTKEWAMVAVQGPRAIEAVTDFQESAAGLRYYHAAMLGTKTGTSPAEPVIVSRTGYTGEDGFEIIDSAKSIEGLLDGALKESAQRRGVKLRPCGLGARDTLRLEAAMPLYGHELTEDIDPFQAGLGWAVKMDKGDFVGREALIRRQQDPTRLQRVGLELEGKRIAREGCAVLRDGQPIGRVTSGTFSPTLNKAIAMAYIAPKCKAPETRCEVDVRGKASSARVVPLPFYNRKRKSP
jgi:aminomethyltransferase